MNTAAPVIALLVASPAFADDAKPSDTPANKVTITFDVTVADMPPEIKAEIKDRCIKKWQDDSDRYMMTASCINREIEAWVKVENFR